jgi:hypothetical protein
VVAPADRFSFQGGGRYAEELKFVQACNGWTAGVGQLRVGGVALNQNGCRAGCGKLRRIDRARRCSPGFIPVITTVAFHAERSNGGVTGEFDCLALAPEAATGAHSGQHTVNAMYVVGKITGASVHGDVVTLTGVSDITGLGVGTNVPFTFIAHRGGPGAAAILTVNSLSFPFNEILVQGAFEVPDQD